MVKSVILHLGLSKTGSSYLQSCFAKSRAQLSRCGISYPDHASVALAAQNRITSGNGTPLAKWLQPDADLPPARPSFLKDFLRTTAGTAHDTVLYSSEFLMWFRAERMAELQAQLNERGARLRCVGYFRSPMGEAWSNYCQGLKRHGYTGTFAEYLEQGYGMPLIGLLERLRTCFEPVDYELRNYDRVRERLFEDFLQSFLSLDPGLFETTAIQPTINRSLTAVEVELLRQFNQRLSDPLLGRYISDTLLYDDPEKQALPRISEEHVAILERRFGTAFRDVKAQLLDGASLALAGPEVPVSGSSPVTLSEFERSVVSILARMAEDIAALKANRLSVLTRNVSNRLRNALRRWSN